MFPSPFRTDINLPDALFTTRLRSGNTFIEFTCTQTNVPVTNDAYTSRPVGTFIATLLTVFLLSDTLWWWFARRRFPLATPQHRRRRHIIAFTAGTAIFCLLWIVASRVTGVRLDDYTPRILIIFTLIWHLLALPVAWVVILLHGTTRVGTALFGSLRNVKNDPAVSESPADNPLAPSRREFLAHTAAFAPVLVAGAGSAYSAATLSALSVRELEIGIPSLPSALDGLSIAHVSDTHLGRFTDAATFRRIVAAVNTLDADLVVHTGDLINDDQSHLPMACELLRQMRSRHGTFLCEGNHDHIGGRERFQSYMRQQRMPIAINELTGVTINGQPIEILGLPWTRGGRTNGTDAVIAEGVTSLARRRSTGAFAILLAHHPHAFDSAVENQIPLTFGGHTHGGQMNLTSDIGFGRAMYRYWSGLYSRNDCHTVISNGAGNWFPLRINAPAEIPRIVLRRA